MYQVISDICRNTLFLEEIIYNQFGRRSTAWDDTGARGILLILAFDLQPSCPAGLKAGEVLGIGTCKTGQRWLGNSTSKTSRGWLGYSTYKTSLAMLQKKSTLTKKTSKLCSIIIYGESDTFVCKI